MSEIEADTDANVVSGTFLVNSNPAYLLFDSGASHSFTSSTFAKKYPLMSTESCRAKYSHAHR